MRRREAIAILGGATAAPLASLRLAQAQNRPVVGFLTSGSSSTVGHWIVAFRKGLSEGGFVEGDNLTIEYRYADGQFDRLPALAADLVQRKVSVIAAGGGMVTPLAAKAATGAIPIVFSAGGDPVKAGLVPSLNRPGGNVTGFALFTSQLESKRLELLHILVPETKLIGFFINPNTRDANADVQEQDAQKAARAFGKGIVALKTYSDEDFDAAFATLAQRRAGAFMHASDPIFLIRRAHIIALAARHTLPGIYTTREFATSGGLMSYGDDVTDSFRQVGASVARILKGAKPAEMPVAQPSKFELVINAKAGKALGLTIPLELLARADDVIE